MRKTRRRAPDRQEGPVVDEEPGRQPGVGDPIPAARTDSHRMGVSYAPRPPPATPGRSPTGARSGPTAGSSTPDPGWAVCRSRTTARCILTDEAGDSTASGHLRV